MAWHCVSIGRKGACWSQMNLSRWWIAFYNLSAVVLGVCRYWAWRGAFSAHHQEWPVVTTELSHFISYAMLSVVSESKHHCLHCSGDEYCFCWDQVSLPMQLVQSALGEGYVVWMVLFFRWVPTQERSRSLAFVYSGMFLGSIFGLSLSPHMIQLLSWPSVFYTFGAVGVGWFLAWQRLAGSNPKEDVLISNVEREYILENSSTQVSVFHWCPIVSITAKKTWLWLLFVYLELCTSAILLESQSIQ